MEIRKFDLHIDDINIVSDLILTAYNEGGHSITHDDNSNKIVHDLVEAGNNFIGHENIYLCIIKNSIAGLIICYTGESYSKVKTLFDLLIRLKLSHMINYLLVGSQLFDTLYTPNLNEDDFYISVIVVDQGYRKQGVGAFMLNEATRIAKQKGCSKIVLDVNPENVVARSLYKKFGFKEISSYKPTEFDNEYLSMEYILS